MSSLPVNSRWAALEKDSSSKSQTKGNGGSDQKGSQGKGKGDQHRKDHRGGDKNRNDNRDGRGNQPQGGGGDQKRSQGKGDQHRKDRRGGDKSRNDDRDGHGRQPQSGAGGNRSAGAGGAARMPSVEPTEAFVTAVVPGSHVLCSSNKSAATTADVSGAAVSPWRLPMAVHPMVATLIVGDAVWVHAPPLLTAAAAQAPPPESVTVSLAPACVRVPLTIREGSDDCGEDGAPLPLVVSAAPAEPAAPAEQAAQSPLPTSSSSTRPLIVLDLNGVLVDRKAYNTRHHNSGGGGGGRMGGGQQAVEYKRRLFCDAFISFCFRHFDVAVSYQFRLIVNLSASLA